MKRIKDRTLKQRDRKSKPKIKYKTLLKLGVKDTKENKQRWQKGEALELIAEAIQTEDLKIKHDSTTNKIDSIFLKEQEKSEEEFLQKYYKDITDG